MFLEGLGTGIETSWIAKRETWQLTPTATLDLQDGVSYYGFTAEVEATTEDEVVAILNTLNLQKITGAQKKEFYRMLREHEVDTDKYRRSLDANYFVGVAATAGAMVINHPSRQ
jgi:rhamnogalacturonyl hydrolase YesR